VGLLSRRLVGRRHSPVVLPVCCHATGKAAPATAESAPTPWVERNTGFCQKQDN
jgi:hypothetical protein